MTMQGQGRQQPPAAVVPSPAARAAPAASPHRGWPRVQPSPVRQQPAAAGQRGLARYGAGAAPEEGEEEDALPPMDDYVSPPPPLPKQQPRSAGRGWVPPAGGPLAAGSMLGGGGGELVGLARCLLQQLDSCMSTKQEPCPPCLSLLLMDHCCCCAGLCSGNSRLCWTS